MHGNCSLCTVKIYPTLDCTVANTLYIVKKAVSDWQVTDKLMNNTLLQ